MLIKSEADVNAAGQVRQQLCTLMDMCVLIFSSLIPGFSLRRVLCRQRA